MCEPCPPCFSSPPGFRFSIVDGVVIAVTVVASVLLWETLSDLVLLCPIVLGHFFLFCNVFRVRRSLELVWAAAFVVNVAAWSLAGRFNWWTVLLVQAPATLACIVLEIRSPAYHGVGYAFVHRNSTPR